MAGAGGGRYAARDTPHPLSAMHPIRHSRTPAIAVALATLLGGASPVAAPAQPAATLFRGVRVFDGVRAAEGQDVLVQGGRIARVGRGIAPPAGAAVVDGSGRTLLPGLIDAHTHSYGSDGRAALAFGVTT